MMNWGSFVLGYVAGWAVTVLVFVNAYLRRRG